jgi:predicted DNA-binding transcriptional regulator YafY
MSTPDEIVYGDALRQIANLRAINAELLAALEEVEDYFEDRADAEYNTDSAAPSGNEEMQFLVLIRAAIRRAKP